MNILITGAAGNIGQALRDGLAGRYQRLRLYDRQDMQPRYQGEEVVQGQLADIDLLERSLEDTEVAVHLGAIPIEAPFPDILQNNIVGTYTLFEAARRRKVRRVVFASTNHVVGFYPTSVTVDAEMPVRPDTYYGVSKVFGEALGSLYHHKWGLEVICLRLGSFREAPTTARELSTWLSHGDAIRLFTAAIEGPNVGFLVMFGVSANSRTLWENRGANELIGYRPEDNAEAYLAGIGDHIAEEIPLHGGSYTRPDYIGE